MYLCIDTTTPSSGITLAGNKTVYVLLNLSDASERILETVDKAIKKAGIKLSDLKGVFVIKGPGSFTGLRIGIAVANQFAHQLKIPIIGLRTDEFWSCRTDEKDFVYLQTMNRSEAYVVKLKTKPAGSMALSGTGRSDNLNPDGVAEPASLVLGYEFESQIIPIEKLSGKKLWLGQLSDEHRQKLPTGFKEITDIRTPEETWNKIIQTTKTQRQKTYDLVEPYYGKEPTITKSKKKLSI